ncbi:uncharacterized protein LOC124194121 [Daphnia pulex]|uniref:uncharacterized protein LOC124194121 n=1 Tax=Daphnia pulex TaxID=6669 RepID=UPI001EDEAA37|nr:uncharacterized protein LOC124194121 [Daphnia pulex]
MKSTIACLLVLAVAAQAQFFGYGAVFAVYLAALPVAYGYPSISATQYHAQDELGQASFGYAHPGQAANNLRDGFGNQIGSYAYINPEGKEVRVSYTADSRGFRVQSNNLPVAPVANLVAPVQVQDTPEVAAAKADHSAAIAAAKSGVAPVAPVAPIVALPAPVQDTPEVAAAKAKFAIKFAAAKDAAIPAVRAKRQAVYGYRGVPIPYLGYAAVSPYAYSVAVPALELGGDPIEIAGLFEGDIAGVSSADMAGL